MGGVVEKNFAPAEDVPERRARMMKSEPAIVAEGLAKLFRFQNLEGIGGVIVGLVERSPKDRFRIVEEKRDENRGAQHRGATPPRASRNGNGHCISQRTV